MSNYCLDLFSGTGSFSAAFRKSRDWETFGIDLDPDDHDMINPDMKADILDLSADDIPVPDDVETFVMLASPPCKAFSLAAHHHHLDDDLKPKTDFGEKSLKMLKKSIELADELDPDYWFIENPRSGTRTIMREADWGLGEPTGEITFCQYGGNRMKATDLWGEHPPMKYRFCGRGEDCHVSAPRGSKTGTQGTAPVKRAMLPFALSLSILEAVERDEGD